MKCCSLDRYGDWGLLVLRLSIAAIFLYHGIGKWQMESASMLMTVLKYAEPIAGFMMLLGVGTQVAAAVLGVIMLGAIYMKMTGFGQMPLDPFGTFAGAAGAGWEFDLMILAGCIAVLLFGAGKYAMDALCCKGCCGKA